MPSGAIDSLQNLFPGSALHLGDVCANSVPCQVPATADESMLLMIMIAVCCLSLIVCLDKILIAFPSMTGSVFNTKEVLNIESSARISRDRNFAFLSVMLPFVIIYSAYKLFPPFAEMPQEQRFVWTLALFFAYLLVRTILGALALLATSHKQLFRAAKSIPKTFFCLIGLLAIVTVGICVAFKVDKDLVRNLLLAELGIMYLLNLVRTFQIFILNNKVLAGFLYLCTLEILPTGALIAAAFLF